MSWRYIAQKLNGDGTATFLDFDVPLQDPAIEDVLSGTPGLRGKITPEVARLILPDGTPAFDEWSTAIWAESEGEIRGGGILDHSGFNGSTWDLECVGFTGYLKDLPYTGNGAYFVETDALDVVRHIWNHVQTQDGSNLGLVLDNTDSGVIIGSELASEEYDPEGGSGGLTLQTQAYKLAWYQDHDLLSNFNGLQEDTPFDYREHHYWDGEEIAHRLEFGVPTIGRRRDDLRFVYGENIFSTPAVERSGDDYADEVIVLGAGEGAKTIRATARVARKRLRRVKVVTDPSLRRVNRAESLARRELAWRQNLDDFTSLVLHDHPHAPIGSVDIGDEIYVEGRTGWAELGAWCRIMNRTLKPNDPGVMDLTVARTDRIA